MNTRSMKRLAAIAAAGAVAAGLLVTASPAWAGTLSSVSWAVSNSQTGAASITYGYQFTTTTSGTIAFVTMTVPGGTTGTPVVSNNVGIGAGTIALNTGTNILTYSVTSPALISGGIPISLSISGLTNTSSPNSYTSTVTTQTSAPATIDSATSQSVTFGASGTQVNTYVAMSTTFSNDTPTFTLDLDPSLAATSLATKTVTLGVQSNAYGGYTLSVHNNATGLVNSAHASATIPAFSTGVAAAASWSGSVPNKFGYAVSVTASTNPPTLAGNLGTAGNYAGYKSAGENLFTAATGGPTGAVAHSIAITNKVEINFSTPAGQYTDAITYTLTPSY